MRASAPGPYATEPAGPTSGEPAGPGRSGGEVAPGFEAVRHRFERFLDEDADYSAQLVVYVDDRVVVDLWGGPHLGSASITGVYSATKGIAAIALATLVGDGSLDLDRPVATSWPEFAALGKEAVSVRQLLSHQAGLVNTERGLTADEFYDSSRAASLLAATRPAWRPGSAFGYHALTIGPLVEELVRRVTGGSIQQLWEGRVRAARGIDFHLGLPANHEARYVPLRPARASASGTPRPSDRDGFPAHALGLTDDAGAFSPNAARARAFGSASIGGVGSARGLAQAYAAMIARTPIVERAVVDTMAQMQVDGPDLVLGGHTRFGVLFMKPRDASPWGSFRAFGHDGAAGALAFADPTYKVSFGYIPIPTPTRGGADVRAVELSEVVRDCIRDRSAPADPMRQWTSTRGTS